MKVYQGATQYTVYEYKGHFYPFLRKDNSKEILETALDIIRGSSYLSKGTLSEAMEDLGAKALTLHCHI